MQKIAITVLLFGVVGLVIAGNWYVAAYGNDETPNQAKTTLPIRNFAECVAVGNPIMESYPEQCRSQDGRTFVNTQATDTDTPPAQLTETDESQKISAIEAVREYAIEDLGVTEEQISIVSVTAQEWPDGCLGLGGPDEMCTMMITSGFEIVLAADDRTVTYRTDQTGSIVKK